MAKSKKGQKKALDSLKPINLNAAGIDIGADSHWVCLASTKDEQNVREFKCYTPDLYALADWLTKCEIETVVMESTGVYWIPIFQILETRGFKVSLVNSHHVKTVPGRKTDVLDCQWLQQLHSYGLLAGSFRPQDEICILRSYIRHRDNLIRSAGTQIKLEESKSKQKPQRKKKCCGNEPAFDLKSHLHRISGVDFTRIDGLGVLTVQTILSEVGLDPSRFLRVKHFTSWLGLCPGSRVSGGKVKSSQTRHVVNRAATSFRLAANALSRSQSANGAFFRRLRARLGSPQAITATAHKLARIFYCLWKRGGEYQDPGVDIYERQYQQRVLHNLQQKADRLGFKLVPHPD